ncbi:MAG: hypothetical protein IPI83_13390 [Sphingomonadales bacterium]|nr:hypothetical protein [Sphingomonadales bacterium]
MALGRYDNVANPLFGCCIVCLRRCLRISRVGHQQGNCGCAKQFKLFHLSSPTEFCRFLRHDDAFVHLLQRVCVQFTRVNARNLEKLADFNVSQIETV